MRSRIEVFYFFYLGAVGVSMPFFPTYLRGLGLSGVDIAVMFAVLPILNLGVPLAWGWLSDRTRRPRDVFRLATLGAAAAYVPFLFARQKAALLATMVAYGVFMVPIIGLADALAAERVRQGADYGRIRLWGSVGFVVVSLCVGAALTARGERPGDPLVVMAVSASLAAAALSALLLPPPDAAAPAERAVRPRWRDVRVLFEDRKLMLILAAAGLHWGCTAPYNTLFGIYLRDQGLPSSTLAIAFSIGVAPEAAALFYFRALRQRTSLETLLAVAFVTSAVRWLLVATTRSPAGLAALQSLHALTFGLFWAAGIAFVSQRVPPALRATGQTLFTTACFGFGNLLGYLASGIFYDARGDAAPTFLAASAAELVPLTLVLLSRRPAAPGSSFGPPEPGGPAAG